MESEIILQLRKAFSSVKFEQFGSVKLFAAKLRAINLKLMTFNAGITVD